MAVGELLLSAFFQVLFDRLANGDLLKFATKQGVHSKLKKWDKKLKMIKAVLSDAEEKQLTDEAVKIWLDDLRDLAYDAEDILDEFATEALQRKLMADPDQHQASACRIENMIIPACFNSPSSVKFNVRIRYKIKDINSRLEELCKQRIELGLQLIPVGTSAAAHRRPPSTSVPTERAVYGRDEDKARILQMVSSNITNDSNFHVIPIVGMAGAGKTTLAREVYNDQAIDDSKFDIRAWVCVSDNFDVLSISKELLESITCKACDLKALNEVLVQLKKAVDGKKFLLVLDDVWNENYSLWETLKSPFMASAPNSKIIVTTRHAHVASTMGPVEHYSLKLLSDEDCWSVFMKHAFESRDQFNAHQISQLFRKKVTGKCGGLPLAASTLGGLLRAKRDDEWEDILNSKLWDLPQQSGILPVLRLSYHYLPSHLKRCFAYCAIFPKDYEFEEKEVASLWIAEGIVQQSRIKRVEDLSSEYFHDLLSRSIFQQSNNHSSKFIMHDLIHDLAQFIFGETSFRLEDSNDQSRRFERARHFSYNRGHFDGKNIKFLHKVKHLRTFLPMPFFSSYNCPTLLTTIMDLLAMLPKLKRLRVLSLRGYYITHLPDSIGDLRLLRYLDLAGTMIRSLPESTSSLLNLQILILRDCSRLMKLPSNMMNLMNLRHLDIMGANLIREMPLEMKRLKNLQILSNFIVGKSCGSGLSDLKNLPFLCGELQLSGLENVTDMQDTREFILRDKKYLEALSLQWGSQVDSLQNEIVEENVLEMLEPHTNIKKLRIAGYGGKRIPFWVSYPSFSKMVALALINCKNCTSLPSLGLLGSLKHLTIIGMTSLQRIGFEIYGECSEPFESLETLRFQNLQEWEYWDTIKENEHVDRFPRLVELSIVGCHKLSGKLPDHLASLETLVVSECTELVVSFSSYPMLCRLEIDECKGLVCSFPIDYMLIKSLTISNSSLDMYGRKGMVYNSPNDFHSLPNPVMVTNILEFGKFLNQGFQMVETLAIGNYQQIKSWRQDQVYQFEKMGLKILTCPEEVSIEENCIRLVSFPEVNFLPSNLRFLKIENSRALKFLPDGMMHNGSQLENLYIKGCHSLIFIARGKLPSSLKRLEIWSCKKLQCLLDDENYDYASSSSSSSSSMSLKHLEIWYCSELTILSSRSQLIEALESLYIRDCPKLESVAERFHSNTHLKEIGFVNCNSLKSIPQGLHNLNSLQQICVQNCPSLVSFPERGLPNTISNVAIGRCEKLKALPDDMHQLGALQVFHIYQCPSIISFPEEGFPANLTSLQIEDLKMYKALIQWGLHRLTSLRGLWISGCHDTASFPDEDIGMMLPSSLTQLFISGFLELKYFSQGFRRLTSLEFLWIYSCPKLTSFPEAGLPSSLLRLYIRNCPLLKKQCKRDRGKAWSKIANIPFVQIDGKFIYDPEEEQ